MYLKSLTLRGFKSFADKVYMVFDPGLNVVVGPNGSGKSNISDAVLWVLGEQSAKMLRGQTMEDVIFSGSSARPPVGIAEVSLVLDNADHTLPIDFADVAITRRMYRSGESEYLINGAPARLRDIQDVLHDSGLGKDTHSIISQGKLDAVLSGRPEERRELIEEAAGISKHRRRKERASRRLDAMDLNLTRAKDLQREISRRLHPLEHQVDQARRHKELADQLHTMQVTLAVDDLRRLQADYRNLSSQEKEAEAAVEIARYHLDEREGDLNRYQSLLEQKGIFVGDLGEQRRRMQDVLGRMDSDMRLLEEKGKNMVERLSEMRMRLSTMEKQRIDAAAERETVSSDLAATRAAVDSLQKNVAMYAAALEQATKRRRNLNQEVAYISGALRDSQRSSDEETLAYARLRDQIEAASSADAMYVARLARIDEQVQQAASASSQGTKRKKEVEEALAAIRDKVSAAEGQIALSRKSLDAARSDMSEKRRALATAEADLAALRSLDHESENSSALVAALSSGAQANRILCRVADLIEVPATLEAAVEALLGDDLAALVVSCDQDASALVKQGLKSKAKGAATVVVREGMPAPESSSDLPGDPLIEVAEASSNDQAVLWALLGRVRIVSNVEEALQARKSHPELCYICPDATIVRVDGRICFGKIASSEQGALERKRRLRKAARLIPLAQKALTDAETNGIAAEEALNKAQEASAAAKGEQARLSGELSSLNSELGRLSAQADSLAAERKQVLQTQDATAQKVEAARKEIGQHKNAAAEASRKADELSERLKKKGDERASAAAEVHEATDRLSEAKLQLATDLERRNHLQSREAELSHMLSELDQRIVATRDAASSLDVVRLRVEPLHGRYEAIRSCALSWAARLKDRASLEEANSDSLKKTIAEAKRSVEEASDALNLSKEAASAIKLKLAKIEVEVKHAIDAISACGRPLEDALEIAAPRDRKALEDKVENIEAELSGLGPVNEVAMEEYEQLKERSDYIATQVDDLNRARTALRKITAAIERKMRKQFTVVFQQVNENFAEVFSLLFPGGHAYLELTDPEHLESTGVEISAQPRGKKLSKMMLMSGGEKSLTALALLFAVYKTRTVPFYIFDEVEAALDDANLTKLLDAIEQLKKTTQLIVISHQRRTMEQADVLYGVSMRADGVSHVVSQRLDRTTGKVVAA